MKRFMSRNGKKPALITGGAGFIGSAFVRLLLDEFTSCHVTNFDALTYSGNLENLAEIAEDKSYEFVPGDITDARAVYRNWRIKVIDISTKTSD